jgi:hypothetical protein
MIPAAADFKPVKTVIEGSPVTMLEGEVLVQKRADWTNTLYREISTKTKPVIIRLVPYYAWNNRGHSEMSVWIPFSR